MGDCGCVNVKLKYKRGFCIPDKLIIKIIIELHIAVFVITWNRLNFFSLTKSSLLCLETRTINTQNLRKRRKKNKVDEGNWTIQKVSSHTHPQKWPLSISG